MNLNPLNLFKSSPQDLYKQIEAKQYQQPSGYREYKIEKLNKAQCEVVSEVTQLDAQKERFKAIVLTAATVAAAVALGGVVFAVTSVVSSMFLSTMFSATIQEFGFSNWWDGYETFSYLEFPENAEAVYKLGSVGLTAMGIISGLAISLLTSYSMKNVMWHWNYANFLEKQSTDAQLRRTQL